MEMPSGVGQLMLRKKSLIRPPAGGKRVSWRHDRWHIDMPGEGWMMSNPQMKRNAGLQAGSCAWNSCALIKLISDEE